MPAIYYPGQEGGWVSPHTDKRLQLTNNFVRDHSRTTPPSITVPAYNTTHKKVPVSKRTPPIKIDDLEKRC